MAWIGSEAFRSSAVGLLGLGVLLLATHGGRVYTSEGARRLAIERSPRAVPSVTLQNSSGAHLHSDALRGHRWVVGFVYTHCATACPALVSELRRVQEALAQDPARSGDRLLSVSFDPERDTPERLAEVARHAGADPERWLFVRIPDPSELDRWLETFGVVVIPDGRGGLEHNSALHVVDARGRLVRVVDPDDVEGALAPVLADPPATRAPS